MPHGFSGLRASTACGLSGCNTFNRNVVQLSTYTMVGRGGGWEGWLSSPALSLSTVLYKPPRSGECVCVRGEHRGVLAWKKNVGKDVGGELILTLTIGLPVQTFARVGKRVRGRGMGGRETTW